MGFQADLLTSAAPGSGSERREYPHGICYLPPPHGPRLGYPPGSLSSSSRLCCPGCLLGPERTHCAASLPLPFLRGARSGVLAALLVLPLPFYPLSLLTSSPYYLQVAKDAELGAVEDEIASLEDSELVRKQTLLLAKLSDKVPR